uniref:Uncharacterized protein n=1 Tax=Panagrolaimus sp. ES5 TaxID=591445 RepID=A0AC34G6Z3_9BILA
MTSENQRNLIVGVNAATKFLFIFTKNIHTGQSEQKVLEYESIENFFEHISAISNMNQIKAIIFCTFEIAFMSCTEAYNFRLKCREFCQKNGIFCYLCGHNELTAFTALSNTKTMVNEGEEVMVVYSTIGGAVMIYFLIREKHYCRIFDIHVSMFPKILQENFMHNCKPKKVVVMIDQFMNPAIENTKDLFKKYNPSLLIHNTYQETLKNEASIEKLLHLMGVID